MNPSELRKHFLALAAPLVDNYVNAALGKEDLDSYNEECRREVWGVLKKLMIQSTDKLDLPQIQGPEDVIKAVESGRCTLEQGQLLLQMYNQVLNPQGSGPSGGPMFNVIINSAQETRNGTDQQSIEGSVGRARSLPMVAEDIQHKGTESDTED